MIVVRDIFRLKFGQAKEAIAYWKEAAELLKNSGYGVGGVRLLTDLAGSPYYTIVLESTFDSMAEWEKAHESARTNARWREIYSSIVPLTETGHREVLTVLE